MGKLSSMQIQLLPFTVPRTMPYMGRVFSPRDIDVTWTDDELWRAVRRRGLTPDGKPTIWGNGFAAWYVARGREELAAARRELADALYKVEAEIENNIT